MITFGVDCHKRTHTIMAVNEVGKTMDQLTITNDSSGHAQAYRWGYSLGSPRLWGIENSGSFGRGLAQHLLSCEEEVLEVSPHLTGQKRRRSFRSDKSDPNDALAVARVVLQDGDELHRVSREDDTTKVGLLAEHRDNLVGNRTRLINQLHVHLTEIEPGYKQRLGQLRHERSWRLSRRYPVPKDDPIAAVRARIIRQIAGLLIDLSKEITAIEDQLEPLVHPLAPSLLSIKGINIVSASKLIWRVGNIADVPSSGTIAHNSGISPVRGGSGDDEYYRVNKRGDRLLNGVFHQIAKTQSAHCPLAKAYLSKKRAEGKTSKHAFRCLKRRMVDIVYSVWKSGRPYEPPVERSITEMAEAAM